MCDAFPLQWGKPEMLVIDPTRTLSIFHFGNTSFRIAMNSNISFRARWSRRHGRGVDRGECALGPGDLSAAAPASA